MRRQGTKTYICQRCGAKGKTRAVDIGLRQRRRVWLAYRAADNKWRDASLYRVILKGKEAV